MVGPPYALMKGGFLNNAGECMLVGKYVNPNPPRSTMRAGNVADIPTRGAILLQSVFTPTARSEEAVHGTVAPWVAWSADFGAGPGISGPATVIVASADATSHAEPWFVRVSDYPGLGSALAWDRALIIAPGQSLERRFDIWVADGRLDSDAVARDITRIG